jgi:hypothetical protein
MDARTPGWGGLDSTRTPESPLAVHVSRAPTNPRVERFSARAAETSPESTVVAGAKGISHQESSTTNARRQASLWRCASAFSAWITGHWPTSRYLTWPASSRPFRSHHVWATLLPTPFAPLPELANLGKTYAPTADCPFDPISMIGLPSGGRKSTRYALTTGIRRRGQAGP